MGKLDNRIDEEDYQDVIREFVKYMNGLIGSNCEEIRYNEKLSQLNAEFGKSNNITTREIEKMQVMTQTLEMVKDNFIDLLGDYDISLSEIMGD